MGLEEACEPREGIHAGHLPDLSVGVCVLGEGKWGRRENLEPERGGLKRKKWLNFACPFQITGQDFKEAEKASTCTFLRFMKDCCGAGERGSMEIGRELRQARVGGWGCLHREWRDQIPEALGECW